MLPPSGEGCSTSFGHKTTDGGNGQGRLLQERERFRGKAHQQFIIFPVAERLLHPATRVEGEARRLYLGVAMGGGGKAGKVGCESV